MIKLIFKIPLPVLGRKIFRPTNRPAALGFDGGFNLSHEVDGFGQGHNNLLIMMKVFTGEGPENGVVFDLRTYKLKIYPKQGHVFPQGTP